MEDIEEIRGHVEALKQWAEEKPEARTIVVIVGGRTADSRTLINVHTPDACLDVTTEVVYETIRSNWRKFFKAAKKRHFNEHRN